MDYELKCNGCISKQGDEICCFRRITDFQSANLPCGGNLHGETVAAASPSLGSGGLLPYSHTRKRQLPVFSLPPELPEAPVSLTVAANFGGSFMTCGWLYVEPYCAQQQQTIRGEVSLPVPQQRPQQRYPVREFFAQHLELFFDFTE